MPGRAVAARDSSNWRKRPIRRCRNSSRSGAPSRTGKKPVQSIEPAAAKLRRLTSELDAKMRELAESDLPDPATADEDDTRRRSAPIGRTFPAGRRAWPCRQPNSLGACTMPGGEAISIVPALEATALEADRYRSEIHPWISLQALLRGSPGLCTAIPPRTFEKIRAAWRDARAAYFNRGDAGQRRESICRGDAAVYVPTCAGWPRRSNPIGSSFPSWNATAGCWPRRPIRRLSPPTPKCSTIGVDPFFWSGCASLAAAVHPGVVVHSPSASRFSGPASP